MCRPLPHDSWADRALRRGAVARFPLLAEAPDGFAQAHRECGNGFEALLSAIGQLAIVFSADFGEQQFGIAQDSCEGIVQFVAEHFAERFGMGVFFQHRMERRATDFLCLAQALFDEIECDRKTSTRPRDEIR